jgi:hypothetical protein
MLRARWATLAVAAGLGLTGCSSLSNLNPFRHRHASCPCEGGPCEAAGSLASEGPLLGDDGPAVLPPTGPVVVPPAGPGLLAAPPGTTTPVPNLAPTPRLVPQATAPTMPYTPPN